MTRAQPRARRAGEAQCGLARLGTPILLDLPDGRLAEADDAAMRLRDAVTETEPDLILTHAPEDYHPDHRALSHLLADIASFRCPILLADTLMGVGFMPEFYVDITPYQQEKQAAIMAHESQEPHRFARAAEMMNSFRAASVTPLMVMRPKPGGLITAFPSRTSDRCCHHHRHCDRFMCVAQMR